MSSLSPPLSFFCFAAAVAVAVAAAAPAAVLCGLVVAVICLLSQPLSSNPLALRHKHTSADRIRINKRILRRAGTVRTCRNLSKAQTFYFFKTEQYTPPSRARRLFGVACTATLRSWPSRQATPSKSLQERAERRRAPAASASPANTCGTSSTMWSSSRRRTSCAMSGTGRARAAARAATLRRHRRGRKRRGSLGALDRLALGVADGNESSSAHRALLVWRFSWMEVGSFVVISVVYRCCNF